MSETSETMGRCFSEVYECRGSPSELKIADAIDRLAADVAAIKAKVDAISPEDVAHFVDSEKAWVAMIENQRDAAIRERNEARAERDEARVEAQRIQDEADDQEQTKKVKRLNARVKWLNAEIERIHCTLMSRTWERDEARADVERLRAELAARPADGNRQATLDSSPAVTEPAAPAPGWLTQEERRILSAHVQALRDQRRAMERGGQTLGYSANPCGLKREADAIDAILARAGSPPAAPPAGWLTDEERRALSRAFDLLCDDDGDSPLAGTVQALLARAGSPPVVVLPTVFARSLLGDELVALQQVKDSLDKAGVAWKEVPRE